MNRLAVFAFLALSALPGAAHAQYVMPLGTLISTLQIGDFSEATEKLDAVVHVYVVRVTEMAGWRISQNSLDGVINRRARVLSYLRSMIRHSREALRALEIHHELLGDVILLTATNDGAATLYVDDR